MGSSMDLISHFHFWKENYIKHCKLKFIDKNKINNSLFFEDEYGENPQRILVASENLRCGDLVLEIPYNLIITEQIHKNIIEKIINENKQLFPDSERSDLILIFVLLIEYHNEESFWKPYFNILPKKFHSPLFWEEKELELLKGSYAYNYTFYLKEKMKEKFNNVILPIVLKYSHIFYFITDKNSLLNEYEIIVNWMMSRAFYLASEQPGMVPVAGNLY
jgi:hypothetical protein